MRHPGNVSNCSKVALLVCLTQLSIFSAQNSYGYSPAPDPYARCPKAAQERERLHSGRSKPKDVAAVGRPALQRNLLLMQQQDQDARKHWMDSLESNNADAEALRLYTAETDKSNLRRLKHIINQNGFPTIGMVGVEGVHAAFLLIQHADTDPSFQKKMLKVVTRRLHAGEISGNAYALLTDRVLRAEGKPQRYGTQFDEREGNLVPAPIADPSHVDQRRRALGLISLANYACVIHAAYRPDNQ